MVERWRVYHRKNGSVWTRLVLLWHFLVPRPAAVPRWNNPIRTQLLILICPQMFLVEMLRCLKSIKCLKILQQVNFSIRQRKTSLISTIGVWMKKNSTPMIGFVIFPRLMYLPWHRSRNSHKRRLRRRRVYRRKDRSAWSWIFLCPNANSSKFS